MARIFCSAKTMVATQSSMQVMASCSVELKQMCIIDFVTSSALTAHIGTNYIGANMVPRDSSHATGGKHPVLAMLSSPDAPAQLSLCSPSCCR